MKFGDLSVFLYYRGLVDGKAAKFEVVQTAFEIRRAEGDVAQVPVMIISDDFDTADLFLIGLIGDAGEVGEGLKKGGARLVVGVDGDVVEFYIQHLVDALARYAGNLVILFLF